MNFNDWLAIITSLVLFVQHHTQDVSASTSIPANRSTVAAVSGHEVTIPCNSTISSSSILWTYYAGTDRTKGVRVVTNCVSLYPSRYQVVPPLSTSSCDLIIVQVNSSDAGEYDCSDADQYPIPVYVTVLDSMNGTQNASYVTGGDSLLISCNLNYSTFSPPSNTGVAVPSLSWQYSKSLAPLVQSVTSSQAMGSTLTSSLALLVPSGPAVISSVTCLVNFTSTSLVVHYPVKLSWNSTQTTVSYCPIVKVLPNEPTYQYSLFTCTADAYPSASLYQWFNSTGTGISNNQTYNITSVGPYNIYCTATNYLLGGTSSSCNGSASVSGISYVTYCPQNVMIYPSAGSFSVQGSTLYCSANATPPASLYQWTVTIGGISTTYTGQNITVDLVGSYVATCTATNNLYGSPFYPCSASNSSSGTLTALCSSCSCSSLCLGLAIGLPVGFGVLFLLILVICIAIPGCYCYKCKRCMSEKNQATIKTTNSRSDIISSQRTNPAYDPSNPVKPVVTQPNPTQSFTPHREFLPYGRPGYEQGDLPIIYAELAQPATINNRAGSRRPISYHADPDELYADVTRA